MKTLTQFLFTLLALAFASVTLAATSPVGATPGNFAVSPSGAATYSIPIQVPPGAGGMQPNLSLVYNSQAGNGIAGVGWDIGGLSAITRCGATIDRDGVKGGVDLTPNDKFCLNGQRLIYIGAVTLPQYSGSGCLEYRTEIESFQRVISCPAQGNGPAYFRVMGKDGSTTEYGYTSDSRGYAQNIATVFEWSVSKIQDANGNYIQFVYNTDSYTTGEHRIDHIDYTYNGTAFVGGVARSVKFNYGERADVETSYVGGGAIKTSTRLTSVQTSVGGISVRSYNLDYDYSVATKRSRLMSLQECAWDTVWVCLPSTTMQLQNNGSTFSGVQNFGTGSSNGYWSGYSGTSNQAFQFNGDFDGDGKEDLMFWDGPTNGWRVLLSNGQLFSTAQNFGAGGGSGYWSGYSGSSGPSNQAFHFTGDFNGDGKTDFMYWSAGSGNGWRVLLSNGHSFETEQNWGTGGGQGYWEGFSSISNQAFHFTGDFNGDGKTDFMYWSGISENGWRVLLSNGSGFEAVKNWGTGGGQGYWEGFNQPSNQAFHFTSDFNGDGKTDFMYWSGVSETGWRVLLSNGSGFEPVRNWGTGNGQGYWEGFSGTSNQAFHFTGDFNGDGKTDFMYWSAVSQTGWRVLLSNGNGFEPVRNWGTGYGQGYWEGFSSTSNQAFHFTGDFNGDGKTDFMYWSAVSQTGWRVLLAPSPVSDSLITITSGLNAQTTLTYKPLTDNSVYTKENGPPTQYPVKDVQDPLYVVSAVSTSNGLGGVNTANYSYTGMKEHQIGRGNLGFHTMTVSGPDGMTSVTTNNQNFPYEGMPAQVNVYKPGVDPRNPVNSYLLSSSVNAFKCLSGTGTSLNSNPALCAPPAYSATASYGSTLYLPFVASSTSSSWDLNGTALPTSTSTVNTLDAYGNTLSATATTSDGYSKTSVTYYNNDITNWRLGWVVASQVSSTVPLAYSNTGAAQTQMRTTLNSYDTLGRLIRTVSEPEAGSYTISTANNSSTVTYTEPAAPPKPYYTLISEYGYDATYGYGNSVKVRGKDLYKLDANGDIVKDASNNPVLAARETKKQIDYVNNTVTATDALGYSEIQTFDPRFGLALTRQDANQIGTAFKTQWTYDGFGRRVKETRADLTSTTTSFTDYGSTGLYLSTDIGYARYSSTTQVLNTSGIDMAPSVKVYYDTLGRELRTETQGFNGTAIYKDTAYDTFGRVKKDTRPYFNGQVAYWTTPTYDALGRVITVTTPDTAVTTTTYNGLTTTVTAPTSSDGKQRKRTEVKNSQGQVLTVTDALNGVITYKYDAQGNVGKVTTTGSDGKTTTITSTFDLRSRKTSMKDPDMGTWTYGYDVLGELISQTDAKAQTATMTFDQLGRMRKRTEVEGSSTWSYDTVANGKGKLAKVTGPTNSYSRTYVYDSLSRPSIVGTSINSVLYNMSVGYDTGTGRVTNVLFPSTVTGLGNFAFYNNYDTKGFLTAVSSLANNGGTKYWQVDANGIDAEGRVISETMADGKTQSKRTYNPITDLLTDIDTTGPAGVVQDSNYTYYTGVPNLNTRSSYVSGYNYTETFAYDALNRVLSANISGGASKAFSYDSLGNIITKTNVGTQVNTYTYGSATVRPHAVASISGTVNGVSNPTYSYDANGNQTIGAGRTLGYTSFNLPKTVTMAAISQSYAYDAEHQRIVMTEGSANTTTYINPRWDAGTHFEKEKKGNIDEYKHYIYAGGRPVAMYVVKRDNGTGINSTYTRYLHTDHLGSVDVITKEDGSIAERLGYDTWGKRRNANGSDSVTQLTSNVTHHGYTGHEMIDSIGLINMNGRWYDPTLGRMMQADAYIQAPDSLQNYNRYSYVMNNPLGYTDPSGYNWLSDRYQAAKHSKTTQAVVGVVVVAAICYASAGDPVICGSAIYGGYKAHQLDKKTHGKLDWKLLAAVGTLEGLKAYGILDFAATFGGDIYNGAYESAKKVLYREIQTRLAQRAVQLEAEKQGWSPWAMNVALFYAGAFSGTRVHPMYEWVCDEGFCTATTLIGAEIKGFCTRVAYCGSFVSDLAESVVELQGFPTLTDFDYAMNYAGLPILAHSLGTMSASNLVAWGLAPSATLLALPAVVAAPPGTQVYLNSGDPVTGWSINKYWNPGATVFYNPNGHWMVEAYGEYMHL